MKLPARTDRKKKRPYGEVTEDPMDVTVENSGDYDGSNTLDEYEGSRRSNSKGKLLESEIYTADEDDDENASREVVPRKRKISRKKKPAQSRQADFEMSEQELIALLGEAEIPYDVADRARTVASELASGAEVKRMREMLHQMCNEYSNSNPIDEDLLEKTVVLPEVLESLVSPFDSLPESAWVRETFYKLILNIRGFDDRDKREGLRNAQCTEHKIAFDADVAAVKAQGPDFVYKGSDGVQTRCGAGPADWEGTFSTGAAVDNGKKLLSDPTVATCRIIMMLSGCKSSDEVAAVHSLHDKMPATKARTLTVVPSKKDYAVFEPTSVHWSGRMFDLGADVRRLIAPQCLEQMLTAAGFHGDLKEGIDFVDLVKCNGAVLRLWKLAPRSGRPCMATIPAKHAGHVNWYAINEAAQMHDLTGLVAINNPVNLVLGLPAIDGETALATVVNSTGSNKTGGARAEAILQGMKRVYILMFGEERGMLLWQKMYTQKKQIAGDASWTGETKGLEIEDVTLDRDAKVDALGVAIDATDDTNLWDTFIIDVCDATDKVELVEQAKEWQSEGGTTGGAEVQRRASDLTREVQMDLTHSREFTEKEKGMLLIRDFGGEGYYRLGKGVHPLEWPSADAIIQCTTCHVTRKVGNSCTFKVNEKKATVQCPAHNNCMVKEYPPNSGEQYSGGLWVPVPEAARTLPQPIQNMKWIGGPNNNRYLGSSWKPGMDVA